VHPIWLSDLLRAENDQVAGLLKQPDKQKLPRTSFTDRNHRSFTVRVASCAFVPPSWTISQRIALNVTTGNKYCRGTYGKGTARKTANSEIEDKKDERRAAAKSCVPARCGLLRRSEVVCSQDILAMGISLLFNVHAGLRARYSISP
jgi:hypothetical protein